jgi:hypothetical protein
MAECMSCGTKFHACSNCCLSRDWEYSFCSERCWLMSIGQDIAKFDDAVKRGDRAEVGFLLMELDSETLEAIGDCLVKSADAAKTKQENRDE